MQDIVEELRAPRALMTEQVKIELLLDKDLVDWVDHLKSQLGFRHRDVVVNQLLREIRGEESDQEITT